MDILTGERSTKRKLEYRYLRTISEVPVPAGADEDLFSGVAEVRPCKLVSRPASRVSKKGMREGGYYFHYCHIKNKRHVKYMKLYLI